MCFVGRSSRLKCGGVVFHASILPVDFLADKGTVAE